MRKFVFPAVLLEDRAAGGVVDTSVTDEHWSVRKGAVKK